MNQEEPVKHADQTDEVKHVRFIRVLDPREARTVGVIDNRARDGAADTNLKILAKTAIPIIGIILIAILITLLGNISTGSALALLITQVALVIIGITVWFHKPRT
jgi:hypothetical protein